MKVKPIFDRVLIKPYEEPKTKSSIMLPKTSQEKPEIGIVVAVGDGINLDGNKCDMLVKVGEKVLFNKYAGAEVKIGDAPHIILRQIDIIGVIDEDN